MASKVESESYIPVGTIYFEEREDGLLHEKEMLKRTMLQHEITFKNQVHELHRLYRVQRDLMQEYQRNNNNNINNNNSQTNSISQNEISIFESNHNNNNNFEFIREGSAQSSSKNNNITNIYNNISISGKHVVDLNKADNISISGKHVVDLNKAENISILGKHVVDLNKAENISISGKHVVDLNKDENGNISILGKHVVDLNKDENISILGKHGVDLNKDENVSNSEKQVVDLNEDVNVCNVVNGSDLDFVGVNKRVGFYQGSRPVLSKVGLDKSFHDREKGGSSAVINNFFTSQINPQLLNNNNNSGSSNNNNPFPISNNNNNGNNNCNNFYMNYKPAQQSFIFPNQFSINPHVYPQSLTINFDPSQINNNNNNNNENNPNNNNNIINNNISYPVLDSSPHYINLDKNKHKSPISGFIHTVPVPVFNNGSFNTGTSENSSFYFNNLSKNSTHSVQGSLNLPWIQNSKLNCERNLNLNEPVQEGTTQNIINNNNSNNFNVNNNKGLIIFGANCKGNNENNKSVTGEDSKKPSSSITTGGVHSSSNLTKLLGFPVFSNPNSSETKPVLDKELESSNNKRTVNIIDLNEAYSPLENNNNNNDNHPLNEVNKGKKAIINFDLNDDLSCENDSSAIDAANNIIFLSTASKTAHEPGSDTLSWFAAIAVAGHSESVPEPESDTDSYEESVLNLKPVMTEDRFGADKYTPKSELGQGGDETGYGSLLFSKGKRGPARKRRQKRDFQRDVLPTLASLSRVEVTEDLHLIGGLVRASGQDFDVALTRRVGRSGSTRRQRGPPQVVNQAGRSDPPQRSEHVVNQTGQRNVHVGSQTGRNDPPQRSTQANLPQMNAMGQRQVNVSLPPRFPVPQMVNLVHVNQGQVDMNMVHVDREQQQNGNNIVIGWERFTRRARRPRGPPAQQHHHHVQGIVNNNNNNGGCGGDLHDNGR